ncbi:hypothetical protein A2210_00225 [Candidatus Woesebacteria bacterium RIFOXYA1_FULL_40_18]|uniref:Sortase n=2 Tax=Candidatus Woeseibacteriota TaxID=1752722 RepID=A0A1F8CJC7_9BACT|nr:MAG: hypothetical protein A2210_00225 [Candidatus Woesebacteria bacterium RIFOXYA1_FULL_40_18]OGM80777.1 MAG: hypothetical protein A2361_00995 [Candidatus Woesebacteria bacterium RIFOXYB1_FULL_40_26]
MPQEPPKEPKVFDFSLILIILGSILILVFAGWRFYTARILSFEGQVQEAVAKEGYRPVSIKISSINLSLDVSEGAVADGVWQISKTGASHLNVSVNPGEGGNTVIYGHNKNSLFGPIRWLEKGAEIEVSDENGNKYIYVVSETLEVTPDKIDYVLPKSEEVLTLYTCTGLFDSKRFIVIAKPFSFLTTP